MANELTTTSNKLGDLVKMPKFSKRIEEVLKDRSPQFVSSLLQVGASLGDDCEPVSIISSAMIAAALNLPIDKNLGFAWIVPYNTKNGKVAQFQMGYKGYIQLALRTGQYSRLNVCEVYEGELEKYDKLTGDLVINSASKKSDKIVGYASYLRLTSGFEHAEYWSIEEVEAHAKRYSKAYKSNFDTPWKSHFDEMAMKTVLSMHIRKWGPMTTAEAKAHSADGGVIIDLDKDPEYPDTLQIEAAKETKPTIKKKEPKTVEVQAETVPPATEAPKTEPAPEKDPIPAAVNEFRALFNSSNLDFELFKNHISGIFGAEASAVVASWETVDDVPAQYAEYVLSSPKRIANMKVVCAKD